MPSIDCDALVFGPTSPSLRSSSVRAGRRRRSTAAALLKALEGRPLRVMRCSSDWKPPNRKTLLRKTHGPNCARHHVSDRPAERATRTRASGAEPGNSSNRTTRPSCCCPPCARGVPGRFFGPVFGGSPSPCRLPQDPGNYRGRCADVRRHGPSVAIDGADDRNERSLDRLHGSNGEHSPGDPQHCAFFEDSGFAGDRLCHRDIGQDDTMTCARIVLETAEILSKCCRLRFHRSH